jgi:DNA-binding beta-propeller fold protein YncE
VAVDGQGNLYVADMSNHRIQKLSPAGEPLAQWGSQGRGPGQFDHPVGVAVDGQGNLYVADAWNHRVQKLSPAGEPLVQFGS